MAQTSATRTDQISISATDRRIGYASAPAVLPMDREYHDLRGFRHALLVIIAFQSDTAAVGAADLDVSDALPLR
jgi:hypothetical protein